MDSDRASVPSALKTPVIFFVFNRPEYTRQIFASIRAARPAQLLVVGDGPRPDCPQDETLCREVRTWIVSNIDWPCELLTEFSVTNLGCGQRIFSGLQWAFQQVEEGIILEDDCLPHPTFFRFCEEMLARFRDETQVCMIAGTNFYGANPEQADHALFSRHCSVWGWATWRRALEGYSLDFSWWRSRIHPAEIRKECADWREHRFICDLFDAQKYGVIDTWDIQWFAHVFLRGGFSVVPGTNLISNIGTIGSHTTTAMRAHHLTTSAVRFPAALPAQIERNRDYEKALVNRHRPPGGWIWGLMTSQAARSRAGPWLRRGWRALKKLRRISKNAE